MALLLSPLPTQLLTRAFYRALSPSSSSLLPPLLPYSPLLPSSLTPLLSYSQAWDSEKGSQPGNAGFATRVGEKILPKGTVHWMKSIGLGFGLSELRMSHIGPKIKILVASFQIYCQLPDTLQLKFPGSSTKVFSALSFVNLSSITTGSPQCYSSFDYVDKLLMTTLTPICIEIVVILSFLAHVAYKVHPSPPFSTHPLSHTSSHIPPLTTLSFHTHHTLSRTLSLPHTYTSRVVLVGIRGTSAPSCPPT